MAAQQKFLLLRGILQTLGLSKEAVEDVVGLIADWLSDKDAEKSPAAIRYPYRIRDDFLSPAELSFYLVLRPAVSDWAIIFTKVNLGDLFYTKSSDSSENRTSTNKIDRKHVDFLLCDPKTLKPILGIELDDKSHQRADRQERDKFVGKVFEAAGLPLARVPAKQMYSVQQLNSFLQKCARGKAVQVEPVEAPQASNGVPLCPKCGSRMVIRSVKSGAKAGEKFWGCPNYPKCRGVLKL